MLPIVTENTRCAPQFIRAEPADPHYKMS